MASSPAAVELDGPAQKLSGRGGIPITLDAHLAGCTLTANEEIHALQIVREALSNVLNHAQAHQAEVKVCATVTVRCRPLSPTTAAVFKGMEPEDLMQLLTEAARGKIAISERLTQLRVASLREKSRPTRLAEAGLTEQESRILDHLIDGKSNKLSPRDLDIAEGTLNVHVKHLLKKLNLRSRVEAAVWADRCRRQAKP